MTPKWPSNQLIAVGWISTLGLAAGVGLELPADPGSWAEHGFVAVNSTVGGSPNRYVPMRRPIVQIDCWANRPNSEKAPWNKAGALVEQIVDGAYRDITDPHVPLPPGFRPVLLRSVFPVAEPRRLPGDIAGFAGMSVDIGFLWTWGDAG